MGLNVSASMSSNFQFENRENLKNTAKNILTKSGASNSNAENLVNKIFFDTDKQIKDSYLNPQLAIIKASNQISSNRNLKETLKYLKSHAGKKQEKQPVLGEIWELFSSAKQENNNDNVLMDFVVDEDAYNIFAA